MTGSGTLVLANTDSYSGGTFVSSGALEASMTSSLPGAFTPGKVSVAGGAMLIAAVGGPQQWTAAEVNQLLAVPGLFSPGTGFGIDASGGSFNPASISSSGSVLTLAGSNSYAGVTAVSQGTLELANSAALANSTVAVNADNALQFSPGVGTFYLGGISGSHRLDLDDTSGGSVALIVGGNGQSTTFNGQITGGGSLTMMGTGTLVLSGSNNYSGLTDIYGGTIELTNVHALADGSGLTIGDGGMFADVSEAPALLAGRANAADATSPVPVPEPSAAALFAACVLLTAAAAHRARKRHAIAVY